MPMSDWQEFEKDDQKYKIRFFEDGAYELRKWHKRTQRWVRIHKSTFDVSWKIWKGGLIR